MGATSEHFSNAELACRHCGVNGCQQSIVDALEAFRAAVGRPVIVDSAYRCPDHNKAVGGVPDSEHVQGIAADIRVSGLIASELEYTARTIPSIHGIGRADVQRYIHIDTREKPAEWCYNAMGAWVHYFPVPEPSLPINA